MIRGGLDSGDYLGLPLAKDLVKVVASLLRDDGGRVCALVFHLEVLQLTVDSVLCLLRRRNLGIQ